MGEHDIMLDVGHAWDAKTTIRRAKAFAPFDLAWIEEPLHPDDLDGYARVGAAVDVPIAAGEEDATVRGFARLIDDGCIDIAQVDMTRTGLTQAMKIAAFAQLRGLPCVNHNFTTDINAAASLHFLAAIPNAFVMEYCAEPGEISRKLARNPVRIEDGTAFVPQEPGLGVEPDPAIVERYLVRH
jgi:L-alanine-DL-glutamate epimerase-like enolase superfamily enzyme